VNATPPYGGMPIRCLRPPPDKKSSCNAVRRGRNLGRAGELIGGTPATSARPEWLGVQGPRPGHSAGFFVCAGQGRSAALDPIKPCDYRIFAQAWNRFVTGTGSAGIARYAFGTAWSNGGLFRHGNRNRISAICRGMPPHGARGQDGAPPQSFGGNGTGVGEARQGS
jgi:hypothetical protein